jgi:peptidoglycan/LPS O-acetylase OafA/YrhL
LRTAPIENALLAQALPAHPKYRPDIDGLRAVAVVSVVVFHAFPKALAGGFAGVDLFFVISGFLISTIVIENLERGSFSFADFYARRVKRIAPALILVLAANIAIGWYALVADEQRELGKHVFAGATFVSNFVLWSEANYFDVAAETKPLLHLWSLGVEEQFYIVWPALLWASWRLRCSLPLVILTIGLYSFALNIYQVGNDAAADFYSPQTRFWELLSGALLAWLTLHRNEVVLWLRRRGVLSQAGAGMADARRPTALADIVSIAGMAFILLGFTFIKPNFGFPGAWALAPVLGAVLMIAAGPGATFNKLVLSHPLAIWFGVISYPLYLWHWPLLSFARIMEGREPDIGVRGAAVLLAIALAWLTYRLFETPIRFGRRARYKTPALVTALLTLGFVGLAASIADERTLPMVASHLNHGDARLQAMSRQIGWKAAVGTERQILACRTRFPERVDMSPKERDDNFCYLQNDGEPNVVLIGDSMNLSLFPGLAKYDDFNVLVLSASEAAPFYNTRTTEFMDRIRLQNYRLTNHALDYAIANPNINVVVLSFLRGSDLTNPAYGFKMTDIDYPDTSNAKDVFEKVATRTLRRLTDAGKKVVYILPNPILQFDVKRCVRPVRSSVEEVSCRQAADAYLQAGGATYRKWARGVLANFPQVRVVDLAADFCDERFCSAIKDGELLYRDRVHLSIAGSMIAAKSLRPLLLEALASATQNR